MVEHAEGIKDISIFSNVQSKEQQVVKWLYSGLYFAITFVSFHYLGSLITSLAAAVFGYHPTFSYNGIDGLNDTSGWTLFKVGFLSLSGPTFGLVSSLLSIIYFRHVPALKTHIRTFLFWVSVNGFLYYFSYIVTGLLCTNYSSIFYSGFVSYYSWVQKGTTGVKAILCIQGLISLAYCFFFIPQMRALNYSRSLVEKPHGKRLVFLNVVFIPFCIGILFILLSTVPMSLSYQLVRVASFIPLAAITYFLLRDLSSANYNIVKGGLRPKKFSLLIIGLTMLVVVARFVLSIEFSFG